MGLSKYTTEVRYICETKAGLTESTGASNVDQVLNGAWNKIFTSQVEFFNESYREVLCKKILKHYYLREIASETVGIWQLWMNTRLEEIMPYYNQLYSSAEIEFDPMQDTDLTTEYTKNNTENRTEETSRTTENSGSSNSEQNTTGSRKNTISRSNDSKDLYSDTPQGGISGLQNMNYLTNARLIEGSESGSDDETTNSNGTTDNSYTDNGSDIYTGKNDMTGNETSNQKVSGKQGGSTYSKMLLEYRQTMLNIDMQVIDEFSDLFFGLW